MKRLKLILEIIGVFATMIINMFITMINENYMTFPNFIMDNSKIVNVILFIINIIIFLFLMIYIVIDIGEKLQPLTICIVEWIVYIVLISICIILFHYNSLIINIIKYWLLSFIIGTGIINIFILLYPIIFYFERVYHNPN